jgi:hypothetical protein
MYQLVSTFWGTIQRHRSGARLVQLGANGCMLVLVGARWCKKVFALTIAGTQIEPFYSCFCTVFLLSEIVSKVTSLSDRPWLI